MWRSHVKRNRSLSLGAYVVAVCALVFSCVSANAQGRRIPCGDPRVKDALVLAIHERYKDRFSGRQTREVGWIGAGHVGFTPEGNSMCSAWVNFQTTDGRLQLLAGTARFEIYQDSSGNVIAGLLN